MILTLNLLFTQDLDTEVTCSKLREKYDIVLDESIIGEVKSMGALADEYEYLMQKSYNEGKASGIKEGETSGFKKGETFGFDKAQEEFLGYWVEAVVNLVRAKKMDLAESMDLVGVRPEYQGTVAEKCRAILEND